MVRTPDPANRRQVLISLTPAARGLRREYDEVSDRTTEQFYKGFTEEEIRHFEATLERILKNLEEA